MFQQALDTISKQVLVRDRYDNFIGGKWVAPVEGRYFDNPSPITGKKALFVNRNFTTGLKGLSPLESDALLEMLYRHAETPEFQCRFRWQAGSVAFWDNRCAQHHAMWDYFPQRRHGYRVTVKGDRPFYRA